MDGRAIQETFLRIGQSENIAFRIRHFGKQEWTLRLPCQVSVNFQRESREHSNSHLVQMRVRERPTAKQWITLLEELEGSLKRCSSNLLHHYPSSASECPWCRMERLQGVLLFVPSAAQFEHAAGFAPFIGDVRTIWAAIEAIEAPPSAPPSPQSATVRSTPTREAVLAKRARWKPKIIGISLLLVAIAIFAAAPGLLIVSLLVGAFGIGQLATTPTSEAAFTNRYEEIEIRRRQAEQERRSRTDGSEFEKLKSSLRALKADLNGLQTQRGARDRAVQYQPPRRASQAISRRIPKSVGSKISHIGPGRLAVLTSYGIETAAECRQLRCSRCPVSVQ